MNRQEWELSRHNLRELLKWFRETGHLNTSHQIKYKFGILYNPMFDFYHLWNGISKNTMATFKVSNNLVVRYRENSYYKEDICKLAIEGKKTILVPSTTLSRNRAWASANIQNRVHREIERVKADFLALPLEMLKMRYTFPMVQSPQISPLHLGPYGTSATETPSTSTIQVTVLFSTQEQMYQDTEEIRSYLDWLISHSVITRGQNLTYRETVDLYQHYRGREFAERVSTDEQRDRTGWDRRGIRELQEREYERYRAQRMNQYAQEYPTMPDQMNDVIGNAGYNHEHNTYHGRPMEQIRQELTRMGVPDGVRVDEYILSTAVERLDSRNEPPVEAPRRRNMSEIWQRGTTINIPFFGDDDDS